MVKTQLFKVVAIISVFAMLWVMVSCGGAKYTNGTYEGTATGHNGNVVVSVTVANGKIASVEVIQHEETAGLCDAAIAEIPATIVKKNSTKIDVVSGATVTSKAIIAATEAALVNAGGTVGAGKVKKARKNVAVSYTAGTYEGTAMGMNGPVTLEVTFSKDAITDIKVKSSKETAHVGDPVFPIMFADAIKANGSGIDAVSGATFTSLAVKNALTDAAKKANASKIDEFKKNKVTHTAQKPIEETYDVVIVGAGGAGMGAAAQAAQNGDTVLVIEKNAEIGGNTVCSGGQFQSVMPYLVWDAANPDATTGVYSFDGKTYNKVNSANGNITILKEILNWNEKPFDGSNAKDWFVAGDIVELSKRGVHAEYLDCLKELKKEIKAYLAWAQPKLNKGINESNITLFSTLNLHIFQTYYGGLRPNASYTDWIYGDYELVKQFIEDGQDLKPWLEAQGALFVEDQQPTLIGALWHRENQFIGFDENGDGKPDVGGQWGAYFLPPRKTLLETSATAKDNKIMLRTDAKELIVENGKVTGVKAVMYDGTKVTAKARKGVIIATGGYAANVAKVLETNDYWQQGYITKKTQTTNRSSLTGSGIEMAEKVNAATTGMAFTQLMPISWIDNGQLAFGGGNYAIYINPTTGKRFVNETSERDVLSLAKLNNGIEKNGTKGVFLEIANSNQAIPGPYPYGTPKTPETWEADVEWRQYTRTVDQFADLFKQLGLSLDAETVIKEIKEYDMALMTGTEDKLAVTKTGWTALIGNANKKADGSFDISSYTLDGVKLKVRVMAPSTHHTMGGIAVDTERHVLDNSGHIIPGLYAAGEVTGGIHGGNRLGGNAIVEIFVSGRTAANSIKKDN
ncbi:MAG: FAD-dependent oxidoreductase [Treponema sp.]|nr:FAD-dependent oxidoreductase [Treponema sp.]